MKYSLYSPLKQQLLQRNTVIPQVVYVNIKDVQLHCYTFLTVGNCFYSLSLCLAGFAPCLVCLVLVLYSLLFWFQELREKTEELDIVSQYKQEIQNLEVVFFQAQLSCLCVLTSGERGFLPSVLAAKVAIGLHLYRVLF